jgi:hypothetical protein
MKPLAIRGTYSDWRLVKTRGVVQIVIEVPLAESNIALEVLGGMPDAAKEQWVAIAPINPEKEVMSNQHPEPSHAPERRDNARPGSEDPPARAKPWRDWTPAQQAGMRCNDPEFAAFLRETRPDDWHEAPDPADCVRLICGVESRSHLNRGGSPAFRWRELDNSFLTRKALERAS